MCAFALAFAPLLAGENRGLGSAPELAAALPPAASAPPLAPTEAPQPVEQPYVAKPERWIRYGSKGLELGGEDGPFSSKVSVRSQLRFSAPFDSPPRTSSQFDKEGASELGFRRARFKMDGHLLRPWIEYKYEHDLVGGGLLDLRVDIGPEWLRLRAGQWKADYSRERSDSSGKQQFTDRTIVNRAFTLDRQKGAMAVGRLWKKSPADMEYHAGVFTGHGLGVFRDRITSASASDGSPLWILRYQWNPLGGGAGASQGDLERLDAPRLSLAVATAGNRSAYTRFSSSGGGQLDGFQQGAPGQYAVRQGLEEATFKYKGLSVQHEWHWKQVRDTVNQRAQRLRGAYLQSGYFPHGIWSRIPKQLEVAGRLAYLDPDAARSGDRLRETAVAVNWFFRGHDDKLTFDIGRYSLPPGGGRRDVIGIHAQWDVTF